MIQKICRLCGEKVNVRWASKHLTEKHPDLLEGVDDDDTETLKDIIDGNFATEELLELERKEAELGDATKALTNKEAELREKDEQMAELEAKLKKKTVDIAPEEEIARVGRAQPTMGVVDVEELEDTLLPPGDWFVEFLDKHEVGLRKDEKEMYSMQINSTGALPDPAYLHTILTNIGVNAVKARRITATYPFVANRYLEEKGKQERREAGIFSGRPMIQQPQQTSQSPIEFGTLNNPYNPVNPTLEYHDLMGGRFFSQPLTAPSQQPSQPLPSGKEEYKNNHSGPTIAEISDVIQKAVAPLHRRIATLEFGERGEDLYGGEDEDTYSRRSPIQKKTDPEIEAMREEFHEMRDAVTKVNENIEEDKKRREKEAEHRQLLEDLARQTDTRLAPLLHEIQSLKAEGGMMKGMTPEQMMDFYGKQRDKDLNVANFDFERYKWKEEQSSDRNFKSELVQALSGAGDIIGNSLGNAVSKNIVRRGQTPQQQAVPQTFTQEGVTGDRLLAIQCPGCGEIIKADKNAELITCLKCGSQYTLEAPSTPQQQQQQQQPPPQQPQVQQQPPPKKKEGGIRIVDRNTGDEVKEPPAVEGVVEEFGMPE